MVNAIIMAAGLGSRLRPLTDTVPKPLLPVHGIPMIETVIAMLQYRQVENIYVVVGYLKEQFVYLTEKYTNLYLLENLEYRSINNISSIKAASDVLKQGDCFICEADLYVSNLQLCCVDLSQSCYFGKMIAGFSEDWVFEQNAAGQITRVGKGGMNCYNMVGVAFLKARDALLLCKAIDDAYNKGGYTELFWDDVMNQILDEVTMYVHEVNPLYIQEIDTVDEYCTINRS